jgi:DNA-binding transcriptional LysR family regulator
MNRLEAMEAYVLVVETGSFSAAARQLQVGQPAISKTIAQLEARLGVQLLIRSTQSLTPTEAGQSFYERARRVIEEAEEAEQAARGTGASLAGELRISAAVTFARLHVVPNLPRLLAAHPALTIRAQLDDRNIDLIEFGIDVALRMGSLEDSSLVARKIAECPRHVVGTAAYFQTHGEPQHPSELASHQAIVHEVRGGGRTWTFIRDGTESAVTLDGRLWISGAEGVREAVFAGIGLAVASEWMFAPELKSGSVRAVLQNWALPRIELWAIFPTGRRASAKARAFVAFLEETLAKDPSAT